MKLIASSIILVLVILNIGVSLAQHNQVEVEVKKHNFWVSLFSAVVQLALFYYAGLFDCFKE